MAGANPESAPLETPDADALEQRQPLLDPAEPVEPAELAEDDLGRVAVRDDVDEADAAEQSHEVGFDDDDYR